jgi:hypothetical protein
MGRLLFWGPNSVSAYKEHLIISELQQFVTYGCTWIKQNDQPQYLLHKLTDLEMDEKSSPLPSRPDIP